MLVGFAGSYWLSRTSAGFLEWILLPGSEQLYTIACIPFGLLLDALVYRVTGNTPGKALLRLKVTTLGGQRLSLLAYARRNLSLWASGLALGFPLLSWITLLRQSARLGANKPASYDEDTGNRVRQLPVTWKNRSGFSTAFVALVAGLLWLNVAGQQFGNKVNSAASAADQSWKNPITGTTVRIAGRWTHAKQENADGTESYLFTEPSDRAAVVFGGESPKLTSLRDYVRAFRNSKTDWVTFFDGGTYAERDGNPAWRAFGVSVEPPKSRVNIEIVHIGEVFWRTVTIQSEPIDYSDEMVSTLRTALWSTAY